LKNTVLFNTTSDDFYVAGYCIDLSKEKLEGWAKIKANTKKRLTDFF
jgi:hypothetical protein